MKRFSDLRQQQPKNDKFELVVEEEETAPLMTSIDEEDEDASDMTESYRQKEKGEFGFDKGHYEDEVHDSLHKQGFRRVSPFMTARLPMRLCPKICQTLSARTRKSQRLFQF